MSSFRKQGQGWLKLLRSWRYGSATTAAMNSRQPAHHTMRNRFPPPLELYRLRNG